jgi:hypothetical protein
MYQPLFTNQSALLSDGRWVVVQKGTIGGLIAVNGATVENAPVGVSQPKIQTTGEQLPFDSFPVNAVLVPKDQTSYEPTHGFRSGKVFRPLR